MPGIQCWSWWWLIWTTLMELVEGRFDGPLSRSTVPCIFQSKLVTDRNWFGFIANLTFSSTGWMTFEFTYPAERCCQNILIYSEQQVSQMSDRLNCWQREYLLNPEDDQILRLTPRFSWSGCHLTHPNNIPTYVCKGGRSFPPKDAPTHWYLAVSNCHTLTGMELAYRIEAYGLSGECPSTRPPSTTGAVSHHPTQSPTIQNTEAPSSPSPTPTRASCRVEGDLNISTTWYGFIGNITIGPNGGGFVYRFSYPDYIHAQNIILYGEEDMARLGWTGSQCWSREAVIKSQHLSDKVMELSSRATWNGCKSMNSSQGGRNLTCRGERRFDGPRRIFVAVSNCRSVSGLLLNYRFDVFGYDSDMCSSGSWAVELGRTGGGYRVLWLAMTVMMYYGAWIN